MCFSGCLGSEPGCASSIPQYPPSFYRELYYSIEMTRGMPISPSVTMTHNGFKAILKRAPKLTGGHTHPLPSGDPIPVFPVDAFLEAPSEWVKGPGSYVCPVESEWGLWFDWTMNDRQNTAILTSVKGLNPITGKQIDGLALERYKNRCPIHEEEFKGDDRFCEKCGYSWPPQNYVCSPNTLWWDGFRADDGTVRQFFFSKEEEADIASAVIGKHNTVPAFGFCFYSPRNKYAIRPPQPVYTGGASGYSGLSGFSGICSSGESGVSGHSGITFSGWSGYSGSSGHSGVYSGTSGCSGSSGFSLSGISGYSAYSGDVGTSGSSGFVPLKPEEEEEIKAVAVGAGAKIHQRLLPDSRPSVREWKNRYGGIIRLYFCFKPQFAQILKGGIRNLNGNEEGFLKGLPIRP